MVYIQTLVHTPAGSFTATGMYTAELAEQELVAIAEYYRFIYPRSIVFQYAMDANGELLAIAEFK